MIRNKVLTGSDSGCIVPPMTHTHTPAPGVTPGTVQANDTTHEHSPTPCPSVPMVGYPWGCVPVGTVTSWGTVERVSLTAYLISGRWVSFTVVHGRPAPVRPLLAFVSVVEL